MFGPNYTTKKLVCPATPLILMNHMHQPVTMVKKMFFLPIGVEGKDKISFSAVPDLGCANVKTVQSDGFLCHLLFHVDFLQVVLCVYLCVYLVSLTSGMVQLTFLKFISNGSITILFCKIRSIIRIGTWIWIWIIGLG